MNKNVHASLYSCLCLAALLMLVFPAPAPAAQSDLKWKTRVGMISYTCPAINDNGMIYGGSAGKIFFALNATNGEGIWNCTLAQTAPSSLAIGSNGMVYGGSYDKKLYALNATTGEEIWNCTTTGTVNSSPAIGRDGTVYFGSADDSYYALNGTTGQEIWKYTTGATVFPSPAIGSDGTVYGGSNDKKLYALNGTTGQEIWNSTTGGFIQSSPAIGSDGTVYVGSLDKKLYAFNGTTGQEIWNCTAGDQIYSSPAIGSDGTVYFGSRDKKLYALNGTTGQEIWNCTMGSEIIFSSPAIGSDGTVYVGSDDKKLHAVNGTTGQEIWSYTTTGYVRSSPAIGSDGTIYVGSTDGNLYAIESSSPGLANAPWPKFRLNSKNRGYNFPPTASAGSDQNVNEETGVTLNGLNSADPDGTIASYAWTQASGSSVTLSSASSSQPTFTSPSVGAGGETLVFGLTVSDNNLAQASSSVTINVTNVNHGPTANAGPDQTAKEGSVVTLDGSNSSDPDSNITTYAWTQTAGTSVTLADKSAATTTFTAPSTGAAGEALTFKLTVTDAYSLTSSDTVIINVTDSGTAPTADAGPDQSVAEGTTVVLSAANSTATDGTITAYSWSQTSGETMTLSATDKVNATFVAPCVSDNASYSAYCVANASQLAFQVTVTDSNSLEGRDSVTITVLERSNTIISEGFARIETPDGGESLGLNCSQGAALVSLYAKNASEVAANTTAPGNLPYGMLDFSIKVSTAGDSANLTVALPGPAADDASWYKYTSSSGWYDYTDNVTFSANRSEVVIHLTDGGAGDSDGAANGFITDPSGLVSQGSSGSSGSSSGCLLDPAAGFGLEWLILVAAGALAWKRGRRR